MKVVIPMSSLETGGGCRVLADIANALVARGHETEIILPQWSPIAYPVNAKVIRVPALKKDNIPYGDIVLANFYTTFQPAYEAWPKQCVRLCQGFEPDWLKGENREWALWTYKQKVPVISVSHWLDSRIHQLAGIRSTVVNLGVDPQVFQAGTGRQSPVQPAAASSQDKPAFPSLIKAWLRRSGFGGKNLWNHKQRKDSPWSEEGHSPQMFRTGIGQRQPVSHRTKVILYIARDPKVGYALKGYDDFVKAMYRLKKMDKGNFIVHMICTERELPLPGILHRTFRPADDQGMVDLYRSADVFVSTSWIEGFGLPPLEAMACGTPVVTTNSGGVMDFCRHLENAYVVPPQNPQAIAHGIVSVLSNTNVAERLVQGGKETARRLTKHAFEQKMVDALETIIQNRRAKHEIEGSP
ncbi:glycosyltransferase family 4 protein [Desmospora profundinema]|uniref:Glycosyltransferase involved in cell wall biosynthesis n=1 Tax=Desmospora profundinema TaxID=1571184 RepID=A0ABU1IKK2_9BACL|nr:glycosyltransferase family 4 protein [Desmospora profundinema]MDR6224335.1 glycosyltransferase involved in cell wall biosynthesis [Desmospora profundinema]